MNIDKDIEILEKKKKALDLHIDNYYKNDCETAICRELVKERDAIENVLSELEKYKNVTYFEKLEDGTLDKIDKERADDLYKHGNGNWLYIQMWKRNEE